MGFFLNFVYTLLECNHIGQSPGTALPIQFSTSGNAICLPSINLDKHCGGRREFKQNYLSIVSENQFCFHQKDIFSKCFDLVPNLTHFLKKISARIIFFFKVRCHSGLWDSTQVYTKEHKNRQGPHVHGQ